MLDIHNAATPELSVGHFLLKQSKQNIEIFISSQIMSRTKAVAKSIKYSNYFGFEVGYFCWGANSTVLLDKELATSSTDSVYVHCHLD